jgi:hypothetical protein
MLSRRVLIPLALFTPLVIVVPTAAFSFEKYINTSTCWIDYSQINVMVEAVPNVCLALLSVIIGEATPMRQFKVHPDADQELRATALTNARATILIAILSASK